MKRMEPIFLMLGIFSTGFLLGLLEPSLLSAKEEGPHVAQLSTKTIVGDLLDVDRDFYIVRGPRGEIQIEATGKTEITEEFGYGDRIKAIVLPNYKALIIQRARPDEPDGVTENVEMPTDAGPIKETRPSSTPPPDVPQASQFKAAVPETKTIVADLLDVDGDFYVVRGEHGEIRIEATPDTIMTEAFQFGDRIKAVVSMTDEAIRIERAGPQDMLGVTINQSTPSETPATGPSSQPSRASSTPSAPKSPDDSEKAKPEKIVIPETRIIEGAVLMKDGDFYVLRGERGEIRIEVTPTTEATETFQFGDRIKATVLKNDKALKIERMP